VPVLPVVRDKATLRGHQYPRRCEERIAPCASAAALALGLNQPWAAGGRAGERASPVSARTFCHGRRARWLEAAERWRELLVGAGCS